MCTSGLLAAIICWEAWFNRFSSSRVSIRSVFQTKVRSETPTSLYNFNTSMIFPQPIFRSSALRYTGAYCCIVLCIFIRMSAVGKGPCALRAHSRRWIVCSPAFFLNSILGLFGFTSSAVVSAD